jgi:hypothetical protein
VPKSTLRGGQPKPDKTVTGKEGEVMANMSRKETYTNAVIDMKDLTITEYNEDDTSTYSIIEALERWGGLVGVTLTLERNEPVIPIND